MPIIQSLNMSPDLAAPREFRKTMVPLLNRLGIDDETSENISLAASEIIVNIVKHGNPIATAINAELACTPTAWSLRISDNGGIFADILERARDADKQGFDNLRESGMGLQILSLYFPDWSYAEKQNDDGFNVLRISGTRGSGEITRPKVLVVEDEAIQAEIINAYLENEFDVIVAGSVKDAEAAISETTPDIIISDVRLPDGDGLELRQRLRHNATLRTTPFIFLTGLQDLEVAGKADELGIDNYLAKPIDKAQLISAIRRAYRRVQDLEEAIGDRIDQDLSQSLTPNMPSEIGDISVDWRSQPSSAGGGDLIYHRETNHGHVIILADLMGHGERAKFHAHVLSGYIAGAFGAAAQLAKPNEILTAISNAFVTESALRETIATAVALLITPEGEVHASSAGHPPPFVQSKDDVTPLPVSGILPGLTSDQEYEVYTHRLMGGERMVLITDGLLEIGHVDQHEAVERDLRSDILETRDQDADVLIERVFKRAFEGSLTGLKDDSTMIVLSRRSDDR